MNFLAGLGSSLGALGTAPKYKYPKLGDRKKDAANMRGDFRVVSRDLNKTTRAELQEGHGEVNDSAPA